MVFNNELKKIDIFLRERLTKEENALLYDMLVNGTTFQFNINNYEEYTPRNTKINENVYNGEYKPQHCDVCNKELTIAEKTNILFPFTANTPYQFQKICGPCGLFVYKQLQIIKEVLLPHGRK